MVGRGTVDLVFVAGGFDERVRCGDSAASFRVRLAPNRWNIEGNYTIFAHDGCGTPQSIVDLASTPKSFNLKLPNEYRWVNGIVMKLDLPEVLIVYNAHKR